MNNSDPHADETGTGSNCDSERLWPDGLEMGDGVEFDGDEYEVIGTGPGKATMERVDDGSYRAEVFRWAFSNQVGIELETGFSQDEFGELVKPKSDRSGGTD